MKEFHLIGNGRTSYIYQKENPNNTGTIFTCNVPPFEVQNLKATVIVDFKMMKAIQEGSVKPPIPWVLGFRPKIHMEQNPSFYIKYASVIKEFYTILPDYVPNYTDLSCGHMACHYIANSYNPDMINMYGFDSIFDFDLDSCSDLYLESVRDTTNNLRLTNNWRRIWPPIWAEFPHVKFRIHGYHDKLKVPYGANVEIIVHDKKK